MQLKEWHENFIKLFREEFSKLSEEEKDHVSNMHNYRSPCQIEVFWLKQPEWQLSILTHFKDRPDGEVTINGPYDPSIFQKEVQAILNQSRWHVPIDDSEPSKIYSDRLAEQLHGFVEMAKNAIFSDWKEFLGAITSLVGKNETITHFHGNMANYDYRSWVQNIITETKQQLKDSKIPAESSKPSLKIEYQKGFSTYFLPPIIIGGNPKRTPDEIFHGIKNTSFSSFDKEAFDVMFDDVFILVEKDGFIGVYTDDKIKALEILNTVMMVSTLDGLDASVVREHELYDIEYISDTRHIASRSYSYNSPRSKLFDAIPDKTMEYETRHVKPEHVKKIFEKSADIFTDKSLADDLRILLESTTHLNNSEFPQAFIMSWNIIEKHITQKWKKEFSSDSKSQKPVYRISMDTRIKDLKKELQNHFSDLMELKNIRNNYMHNGRRITQQEARKCVDISKELALKNSNLTW